MGKHGGNPWGLAKRLGIPVSDLLDFSADLNPFGPPPQLGGLLEDALEHVAHYPEPTYREFREAAGEALHLDPDFILPGNGSVDLIHRIARWRGASKAVVAAPTFTEYERAVQVQGSSVIHRFFEQRENRFDPPSIESMLLPDAQILFLCNPNNPTGTLWPEGQLLELVDRCRCREILVVVDEATMDLVRDGLRYTLASHVERFPNLLVLRSLTKGYGVPGLRAGYLAAAPEVIEDLSQRQPPWVMNGIAAFVGSRLLWDSGFLKRSRERLEMARVEMDRMLRFIPEWEVFSSASNFILCRLPSGEMRNDRLADQLQEQRILIRTCDDFTGLEPGRFIRMSVRSQEENRRLTQALSEVLCLAG